MLTYTRARKQRASYKQKYSKQQQKVKQCISSGRCYLLLLQCTVQAYGFIMLCFQTYSYIYFITLNMKQRTHGAIQMIYTYTHYMQYIYSIVKCFIACMFSVIIRLYFGCAAVYFMCVNFYLFQDSILTCMVFSPKNILFSNFN